jgi:hypothetical protein
MKNSSILIFIIWAIIFITLSIHISEENKAVELSQTHITSNKNKSCKFVSEKFLDKVNMILANTIEADPIWRKKKRIYYMEAHAYRESFGSAPVAINRDIWARWSIRYHIS